MVTLILYRGPYRVAGCAVTTYLIAAVLIAACRRADRPARATNLVGNQRHGRGARDRRPAHRPAAEQPDRLPYLVVGIAARRYRAPVLAIVLAATGASIVLVQLKTRVNHVFAKAGLRDRAQAVAYAYRAGRVDR